MADEQVWYDLAFYFSSGEPLYIEVLEGRDRIEDTHMFTKVTVLHEGEESTLTIHRDKLNGVRSTKRIVKPEPAQPWTGRQHGDSILEMS